MLILFTASALAGALGRRMAGGLLSQWLGHDIGTQPGRAAWAALMAACACLALLATGGPWWLSIPLGAGLPIGAAIRGNSPGMGLTGWADAGWLTLHGAVTVAIPAATAWWVGLAWWWIAAGGLLCAPAYWIAWRAPLQAPWLGCHANRPGLYPADPPPTAELIWGALLGAALVAGVVL